MEGKLKRPRRWDVEAFRAEQARLAVQVVLEDGIEIDAIRYVAGLDAAFRDRGAKTLGIGAAVICSYPELEPVEEVVAVEPVEIPYVPGYLSFRELPFLLEAWEDLAIVPDVALIDGQGLAHPRRLGLACHFGLAADAVSVGCAKSRLVGEAEEVPPSRGSWRPLFDGGERVGAVVRTRGGVRPVYVSPGHRISVETAVQFVLACAPRYRIPEPIRLADHLVKRKKKELK